jgi:peptidoglycan/xylan/chitin deacetylase (PgdA/CDA1 family)
LVVLKTSIIALAGWVVLCGCSPAHGVPIFLWHSVGEGIAGDPLDVPPAELDQELKLIDSWGATVITLDQLFDAREGKGTLPPRPVVLTFDDGRACLRDAAMPVLMAHHMVAEAFVVTSLLAEDGAPRKIMHDAYGDHPMLSWADLAAMNASGAFAIESHAVAHEDLQPLPLDRQRVSARDSRRVLRERLGAPVDFFAYPFGAFGSATEDAVREAGYRGAVVVQKGLGSRFAMRRVSVHRGYPSVVRDTLQDYFGGPPAAKVSP